MTNALTGGSDSPRLRRGMVLAWAVVLVFALFLAPLALDVPLLDPDEGLHAAIAQEMVERGDIVTPSLLGTPFFDKPILFFWAQALSLRLFGMHEAAIRIVGLAFGLLGALTTGTLTGRIFGREAGWLAAACYATLILPLAIAQAAVHDVALVPWVTLALLALWEACRARTTSSAARHSAAAGLWLGLAMLTKGLVGVAIVGIAIGLWVIASRRVRPVLLLLGLVALLVASAIALPWYLAVERSHPGYLHYFFVERHLLGYATETQRHGQRAWWYYIPLLLGGGLPWALAAPFARVGGGSPEETSRRRDGLRLAWGWLAGGFAFLSLAGSKLVTYLLPLFPAVAILASAAWTSWLAQGEGRTWRMTFFVAQALPCGAMAVLVLATTVLATQRYALTLPTTTWIVMGLLAAAWIALPLTWRHRPGRLMAGMLVLTAGTLLLTLGLLLRPVSASLTARELAGVLNRSARFPSQLWVLDARVGSLVFYLSPAHRARLGAERIRSVGLDTLLRMRQPPPDTLVAVSGASLARLRRRVDLAHTPFTPAGQYRLYTADALHEAFLARTSPPSSRRSETW